VKTLLFVMIGAVVCVVLFVAGIFRPRRSRRMQGGLDRLTRSGEQKSKRRAGTLGDLTGSALTWMRKAVDKSAEKGRALHDILRRGVGKAQDNR
jgi:hypothetical protein